MSTELARRAAAGDTGPEVARWIAESMRLHLDGAELDKALRLDRASRLRERNQALQDAAALIVVFLAFILALSAIRVFVLDKRTRTS